VDLINVCNTIEQRCPCENIIKGVVGPNNKTRGLFRVA